MSNYKVFQINCNPALAELLIAELAEIGFEGFLENDQGFEAYLEEATFDETLFNEIIFKYSVDKSQVIASNIAAKTTNKKPARKRAGT